MPDLRSRGVRVACRRSGRCYKSNKCADCGPRRRGRTVLILACTVASVRRSDQPGLSPFRGTRRTTVAERPQRRTNPPGAPSKGARAVRDSFETDTQTDMLLGEPKSAICVQRFDDSLNSAIHTTYRTWLRSSSMHEPRDPPLKVVCFFFSLPGLKPVTGFSRIRVDGKTQVGAGRCAGQRVLSARAI